MIFQGIEVTKGDEVVLQRGKSRVTVTYRGSVKQVFSEAEVGFTDSEGQVWYTDSAHKTAWNVVGYIQQEVPAPEPVKIPTTSGVYRAVSDDGEDILLFDANIWMYGGYSVREDTLAEYTEFIPLYAFGEHFTVQSSDGSKFYDLVRLWDADESGRWEITCTCKGYHFRKECKHSKYIADQIRAHEAAADA
jgi:hypothetical protein